MGIAATRASLLAAGVGLFSDNKEKKLSKEMDALNKQKSSGKKSYST